MRKLWSHIKTLGEILKESLISWWNRDPWRNSTVIAYYTIFSLPGLGIIIINVVGYFYGEEAITDEISGQLEESIGSGAAESVEQIISNAYQTGNLTLASLVSLGTLLFGATGVFYQVQQALNYIWEVEPRPDQMLLKFLKDRLFSLGMVLMIGFLLLVSLILTSLLSALGGWLSNYAGVLVTIVQYLNPVVSLAVITLLFAAIFKFLPDVKIGWRDVFPGALVTALLFVVAELGLGYYFDVGDPGSIYGAAGSIILILLWATYAGLILLFGAEFTRVYAHKHGREVEPSEVAVSTTGDDEKRMDRESQ